MHCNVENSFVNSKCKRAVNYIWCKQYNWRLLTLKWVSKHVPTCCITTSLNLHNKLYLYLLSPTWKLVMKYSQVSIFSQVLEDEISSDTLKCVLKETVNTENIYRIRHRGNVTIDDFENRPKCPKFESCSIHFFTDGLDLLKLECKQKRLCWEL